MRRKNKNSKTTRKTDAPRNSNNAFVVVDDTSQTQPHAHNTPLGVPLSVGKQKRWRAVDAKPTGATSSIDIGNGVVAHRQQADYVVLFSQLEKTKTNRSKTNFSLSNCCVFVCLFVCLFVFFFFVCFCFFRRLNVFMVNHVHINTPKNKTNVLLAKTPMAKTTTIITITIIIIMLMIRRGQWYKRAKVRR